MNYYLITSRRDGSRALATAVGREPMVPLHRPRAVSYYDDKKIVPLSREEFFALHPEKPTK